MKLLTFGAIPLAGIALAQGCVDTSPIDYHPITDASGNTLSDAAILGEGGLAAACRECLDSTCSAEFAACRTNERCALTFECLRDAYCLNYDVTNLANLPPCLLECALKAGLTSAEDPAVAVIAPILGCAQTPTQCGSVCNVR